MSSPAPTYERLLAAFRRATNSSADVEFDADSCCACNFTKLRFWHFLAHNASAYLAAAHAHSSSSTTTPPQLTATAAVSPLEAAVYAYLTPALIVVCLLSVAFNVSLIVVARGSRVAVSSAQSSSNKKSILILSLNLALTDVVAALLNGLNLTLNSLYPSIVGRPLLSQCQVLAMEVLRIAAFVASALHLLMLAFEQHRGLVTPFKAQSTIFFSNHLSRAINTFSLVSWAVPVAGLTLLYSLYPCQAFNTDDCNLEFFLTFKYRALIFALFLVPLLIMCAVYTRIFVIIHQLQAGQRRQQLPPPPLPTPPTPTPATPSPSPAARVVAGVAKAAAAAATPDTPISRNVDDGEGVEPLLRRSANSSADTTASGARRPLRAQFSLATDARTTDKQSAASNVAAARDVESRRKRLVKAKTQHLSLGESTQSASARHGGGSKSQFGSCQAQRKNVHPRAKPASRYEAVFTTLLILGTYVVGYGVGLSLQVLTCADGCKLAYFELSKKWRFVIGIVSAFLLISKSIVDPIIYLYRMREIRLAVARFYGRRFGRLFGGGGASSTAIHRRGTHASRSSTLSSNTRATSFNTSLRFERSSQSFRVLTGSGSKRVAQNPSNAATTKARMNANESTSAT